MSSNYNPYGQPSANQKNTVPPPPPTTSLSMSSFPDPSSSSKQSQRYVPYSQQRPNYPQASYVPGSGYQPQPASNSMPYTPDTNINSSSATSMDWFSPIDTSSNTNMNINNNSSVVNPSAYSMDAMNMSIPSTQHQSQPQQQQPSIYNPQQQHQQVMPIPTGAISSTPMVSGFMEQMLNPAYSTPYQQQGVNQDYNFDDEPPLLEELGINFQHIYEKTSNVLLPYKPVHKEVLDDADLAGPLVFSIILGICLLLRGRLHFGYIFGFGVVGSTAIYVVLNLISQKNTIDLFHVFSVLGYSLLPIVNISAVAILISLRNYFGAILALAAVIWATNRATRFFEVVMESENQRFLIAYVSLFTILHVNQF